MAIEDKVFDLMNEGGESVNLFGLENENEGMDVFDAINQDAIDSRIHHTITLAIDEGKNPMNLLQRRFGYDPVDDIDEFLENYKPNASRDLISSDADKEIYDHVFFGDDSNSDAFNAEYKNLVEEAGYEYDENINLFNVLGF